MKKEAEYSFIYHSITRMGYQNLFWYWCIWMKKNELINFRSIKAIVLGSRSHLRKTIFLQLASHMPKHSWVTSLDHFRFRIRNREASKPAFSARFAEHATDGTNDTEVAQRMSRTEQRWKAEGGSPISPSCTIRILQRSKVRPQFCLHIRHAS